MNCSQAGISLVEVLVAIILFMIGTLTVMTLTLSSLRANSNSHAVDESVNLARMNMDRLLSLDYEDGQLQDTNADGSAGLLTIDPASTDFSSVSGRYQVVWNVASDVPVNGTKTLSVIVLWPRNGGLGQVAFQTIKAE